MGSDGKVFPWIDSLRLFSRFLPSLTCLWKCKLTPLNSPITQYFHSYNPDATSLSKKYKPILRSSYTSIGIPYIEIQFAERAVPVPQACLGGNSSLSQRKNGAVLKLETKDEAAFADLYMFLTKGRYEAASGVGNANLLLQAPGAVVDVLPNGLAILDQGAAMNFGRIVPAAAKPMLADVRAYRVGATLEIPELQHHALQRLWNWGTTTENPVHVLEYLYHGTPIAEAGKKDKDNDRKEKKGGGGGGLTEPDELLRHWCREWMKAKEDRQGGKSNLEIIKDPMRWGAVFRTLREKGGLLIADADAAEVEARHEERYGGAHGDVGGVREAILPRTTSRRRELDTGRSMGRIGWMQVGDEVEERWENRRGDRTTRTRDNYMRIGR